MENKHLIDFDAILAEFAKLSPSNLSRQDVIGGIFSGITEFVQFGITEFVQGLINAFGELSIFY